MHRLSLTCSLAAAPLDRVLEHSVTCALIGINDPATAAGLQAQSTRSNRAALIALDQMDTPTLRASTVVSLLDSTDDVLNDTAWWIAGHHPEWGDALAGFFRTHLTGADNRDDLQQKLVQFGDNAAIQALIADMVTRASSKDERVRALGVMASVARTRLKTWPSAWVEPIEAALLVNDNDVVTLAVSTAHAIPLPKDASSPVRSSLLRTARDSAGPIDLRVDALAALQDPQVTLQSDVFDLLKLTEPVRSTTAPRPRRFSRSPLDLPTHVADLLT